MCVRAGVYACLSHAVWMIAVCLEITSHKNSMLPLQMHSISVQLSLTVINIKWSCAAPLATHQQWSHLFAAC